MLATDPTSDVFTVIEIDKCRKFMHADPFHGFITRNSVSELCDLWGVLPNLIVTVHAQLRGRNSGNSPTLGSKMTIPAIDLVLPGVDLM